MGVVEMFVVGYDTIRILSETVNIFRLGADIALIKYIW